MKRWASGFIIHEQFMVLNAPFLELASRELCVILTAHRSTGSHYLYDIVLIIEPVDFFLITWA